MAQLIFVLTVTLLQLHVYLGNGKTITLGTLASGADIGVTSASNELNIAITGTNNADYSQYFHADNSNCQILNKDNVLYLYTQHTHIYSEATCVTPATCACGATTGEALDEHDYVDGFCSMCGIDSNGFHHISTAEQLFLFAEKVNSGSTSINAVLTKDIDLDNKAWTPIGNSTNKYTGTFDGAGYTINDFALNITTGGDWGLFGFVDNATVKNFSINGEVISKLTASPTKFNYGVIGEAAGSTVVTDVHSSVNFTSNDNYDKDTVAGIIGANNYTGADFAIERCSYSGTLDLGSSNANCTGGMVAYVYAGHAVKINNCLFSGKIVSQYDGALQIGGMIGYYRMSKLTITNCLSVGTITSTDSTLNGMVVGVLRQHSTANTIVTNNYYTGTQPFGNCAESDDITDGYGSQTVDTSATAVSDTQLTSGEVAYKLGTDWGQTLNTDNADKYPVLGGATVYYGYVSCAEDATAVYTNDSMASATKPAHSTAAEDDKAATCNSKAYCSVCKQEYGDFAENAHDWSNLDGVCANGCSTTCTHENVTDETCTVCGTDLHTCDFSGEWAYDAQKHWKECECGLTSEEGTHSGGEATCVKGKLCEACGQEYGDVAENAHDWSNLNGICANDCGKECAHDNYTEGVCDVCDYACTHDTNIGECSLCGKYFYAITHQPTDTECYIELNDETDAVYQWYKIADVTVPVTDANASKITNDDKAFTYNSEIYTESSYDSATGKWTTSYGSAISSGHNTRVPFKIELQANETLVITGPLNCDGIVMVATDRSSTVLTNSEKITFTATKTSVYYPVLADSNTIVLSATVTKKGNVAVDGATSANFTPTEVGSYFCEVTFADGTTEMSEVFEVGSADYTAYDAAVAKVNGYLADETITDEAKAYIVALIKASASEYTDENGYLKRDLIASEQYVVNYGTSEVNKLIAGIEEKIASGDIVKADYTEIDAVIAEIDKALEAATISEEMKAELADIKADLEALRANTSATMADVNELLERADSLFSLSRVATLLLLTTQTFYAVYKSRGRCPQCITKLVIKNTKKYSKLV